MKKNTKAILALFSAALLITGASGTSSAEDQVTTPAVVATIVNTASIALIADVNGRTLYTFDNDHNGVSTCTSSCAVVWPIVATNSEVLSAPFGIHLRADGVKQVTYKNSPVYLYKSDVETGDIKGDGIGGIWHVIPVAL